VQTICQSVCRNLHRPPFLTRTHDDRSAPWGVLGQGKFKTPEQLKARLRGGAQSSEAELKLAEVLQNVAKEVGNGAHPAGGESSHEYTVHS